MRGEVLRHDTVLTLILTADEGCIISPAIEDAANLHVAKSTSLCKSQGTDCTVP